MNLVPVVSGTIWKKYLVEKTLLISPLGQIVLLIKEPQELNLRTKSGTKNLLSTIQFVFTTSETVLNNYNNKIK